MWYAQPLQASYAVLTSMLHVTARGHAGFHILCCWLLKLDELAQEDCESPLIGVTS